jgi:hypothetical protein
VRQDWAKLCRSEIFFCDQNHPKRIPRGADVDHYSQVFILLWWKCTFMSNSGRHCSTFPEVSGHTDSASLCYLLSNSFDPCKLFSRVARYFQTKNPNWSKLWRVLQWKVLVPIFHGDVVNFLAIWYN